MILSADKQSITTSVAGSNGTATGPSTDSWWVRVRVDFSKLS